MGGIPDSTFIIGSAGMMVTLIAFISKQIISKLDELVKVTVRLDQTIAIHNEKLESGATQFAQIKEHLRAQDEKITQSVNDLTRLEIKVASLERCSNVAQ